MEDINFYFIGDFYVLISVNNILVVLIDNYLMWGNEFGLDLWWVIWKWVEDVNDCVLCDVVIGLGGIM